MKPRVIVFALVVALAAPGAAGLQAGAAPSGTEPSFERIQAAAPPDGSAENLGEKIGSSHVETLKQVAAMLKDRLPADQVKAMLKDMKAWTIDLMVGLGKEREALSAAGRAVVDRVLGQRISGVPADLFAEYQEGQAYYQDDSELFDLIADFNVITRYANFDLLKKQLPEEAKRLGIQ